MKISYNWLKNYIPTIPAPDVVAALLTESGLEVEAIEPIEQLKGGLAGVVTGQVLTCEKHPDSDHLSLTTVDVGAANPLPIVCGAPNVAAGQKVLVATVGTTLEMNGQSIVIKKAKIRGVPSEGMICAEDELGIGTSHAGIMVLAPETKVGVPAKEFLGLKEDFVFEIGLTPNRTDATSHIGVAREIVACIKSHYPEQSIELIRPTVEPFTIDNTSLDIEVIVENLDACPRYSGLTISGVKVAESPEWLKTYLTAIGQRPINNIVDITNFVLMETGQPLHAFDAAEIAGNKILVRNLPDGTPFVTLDGIDRKLSLNDLMICNQTEGMCIAGVFGGQKSGVSEKTTDIFLESACFSSTSIRKTGRLHMLHTDASFRFERGSDPNMTIYALKRAALLIKEIAGGQVSSSIKDVKIQDFKPIEVVYNFKNASRLIGKEIQTEKVVSILKSLEYEILHTCSESVTVAVPTYRVDVTREADVIEDVLRIYGYNNVAFSEELHTSLSYASKPDPEQAQSILSDMLSSAGFSEIMNNSLTTSRYVNDFPALGTEKTVHIVNPLSKELDVMRQSLLFGVLETIIRNQNQKVSDVKIYEFGKVYGYNQQLKESGDVTKTYQETKYLGLAVCGSLNRESWNKDTQKAGFYFLRSKMEQVFKKMGLDVSKLKFQELENDLFAYGLILLYRKEPVAMIGQLAAKLLKYFDIKQEVAYAEIDWNVLLKIHATTKFKYESLPKFPPVRRDLALLVSKSIKFSEIESLALQTETKLLKKVGLFDIFEGEKIGAEKKSYAVSFILRDDEKTLTDEQVDKTMERLLKAFREKLGAELR